MNLQDKVLDRFSAEQQHILQLIAAHSAETDTVAYLVGGIVRDLLLNQPLNDLDIAIVGNAIPFAKQLQQKHGGDLITHEAFKTATWTPTDAVEPIDLITARSETYAHPAALPTVAAGSMADDLRRRDFTINTLAMRLDSDAFGELVDLFDGSADLHAGAIRILHNQSFVDDPTRIFRAVRYEQRLHFTIEPQTLTALQNSLDGIQQLTPARVRHEFEHILAEPNRFLMLARMAQLGILTAIQPQLEWRSAWEPYFAGLADSPFATQFEARLLFWLSHLNSAARLAILERLGMGRKVLISAEAIHTIETTLQTLPDDAPPSQIEQALRPFAKQPLACFIVSLHHADTQIGTWLDQYDTTWRHVKPHLNGNDLRQLGYKPGPQFRMLLDQLRAARLDGQLHTRADEEQFLASRVEGKV